MFYALDDICPEQRRRSPQCHRHEARGRCSYDVRRGRVTCCRNPYQTPLSTPAAVAPTHEHRSQWREVPGPGGRTGRCSGGGGTAQRLRAARKWAFRFFGKQ
jgi:hypothetical protein